MDILDALEEALGSLNSDLAYNTDSTHFTRKEEAYAFLLRLKQSLLRKQRCCFCTLDKKDPARILET